MQFPTARRHLSNQKYVSFNRDSVTNRNGSIDLFYISILLADVDRCSCCKYVRLDDHSKLQEKLDVFQVRTVAKIEVGDDEVDSIEFAVV